MAGPLSGMRVLDLTCGPTGAICGMLLSDYGAEVVKVEPPGGTAFRRAELGITWDRGKRSLVADFGDSNDLELVKRLAETADVVMVGLRPGRTAELGLDCQTLAVSNPALVYCEISAFGPRTAGNDTPGYDLLAAAQLGVMAAMPGHRDGPVVPGSPTLCYGTALMATIAILAAIRARLVGGRGEHIKISHEDGFLALMTMNWKSERGASFVKSKAKSGQLDLGKTRMLIRMFTCADGRKVQIHTGATGAFGRAMDALGVAGKISPVTTPIEAMTPLTDEDLAVLADLPTIFLTKNADEWCELLWANEVACLPVHPPGVAYDDPQVRHAGVIRTIDDPQVGTIEVVGPVVHFSKTPGAIKGPAPRLGQDSAALRERGWSAAGLEPSDERRALSHPLEGIRVVEFSAWFASPYGNRLLADLGADVIKVEPQQGDGLRSLPDPFEGGNRGKRAISFDLKATDAKVILNRLLEQADVIQNNMRPGVAERLGIDYATASSINPSVIYDFAPGYGSTGPKAQLQSFAPLLGGFTGLMSMFGGRDNDPHIGFGNEDYFNGQLVAASILLGLIHRERSGEGQYIEGPQLHSSLLITSEWYLKDGQPRSVMPQLNSEQTGFGPGQCIYQCMDGWVAVACTKEEHTAALVATVLSEPSGQPRDSEALSEALTYEFFCATVEDWIKRLRNARVPCAAVVEGDYYQQYLDDDMVACGRVFNHEHRTAGQVRGPAQMFRLARHAGMVGTAAPGLGQHSREILVELGLGAVVDRLIEQSIVVASDQRSSVGLGSTSNKPGQ